MRSRKQNDIHLIFRPHIYLMVMHADVIKYLGSIYLSFNLGRTTFNIAD